jgi:hypothetical protein
MFVFSYFYFFFFLNKFKSILSIHWNSIIEDACLALPYHISFIIGGIIYQRFVSKSSFRSTFIL